MYNSLNNRPAAATAVQAATRPTYVIRQGVCMKWADAVAYDAK